MLDLIKDNQSSAQKVPSEYEINKSAMNGNLLRINNAQSPN